MKQYRICWQNKRTGFEGNGSWCNESELEGLQSHMEFVQKMYPDVDHWIESRLIEAMNIEAHECANNEGK